MIKLVFSLIYLCLVIPMYHSKSLKNLANIKTEKQRSPNLTSQSNSTTSSYGALGMVAKAAPIYVPQIHGPSSLPEHQKITLMDTAHILRMVLSI